MRHQHPLLLWIIGVSLAAFGLISAFRLGRVHGWVGFVIGFVVPLLWVLAALLVLFGVVWLAEFLRRAGPRYPPCHNGTCTGCRWPSLTESDMGDYERAWVDDQSALRCTWGPEYVTREAEKRILHRLPDGTLEPYMVHTDFRGWHADEAEEMSSVRDDEEAYP